MVDQKVEIVNSSIEKEYTLDTITFGKFYKISRWDDNKDLINRLVYCYEHGSVLMFSHNAYSACKWTSDNRFDKNLLLKDVNQVSIKFE